jgi:Na+/H+-dicarboxylate symporter
MAFAHITNDMLDIAFFAFLFGVMVGLLIHEEHEER